MNFTDDDLKRLKTAMTIPSETGYWLHDNTLKALFARLEAAELAIEHARHILCGGPSTFHEYYETWCRAAGK